MHARACHKLVPDFSHRGALDIDREDLTEKGHFGSSILNFETVAPLADECAVLADC